MDILEHEKREIESVSSELHSSDESDTESGSSHHTKAKRNVIISPRRPSVLAGIGRHHYGSFYLRMGAVGKYIKLSNSWSHHQSKFLFSCVRLRVCVFSFWHRKHDLLGIGIWPVF